MDTLTLVRLIVIGGGAGLVSGLFGIGGGILIVPALVVWLGYTQQQATGTSLAILLPPIGLAAVLEYARHGNVEWKSAAVIALTMFAGSYLGARFANRLPEAHVKLAFGLFVTAVGLYVVYTGLKGLRAA